MFPPINAKCATRFTTQGVVVDVVWVDGGTRVYYPIVADWIDQEIRVIRGQRSVTRRKARDQPAR
jgi:hypothetical protein